MKKNSRGKQHNDEESLANIQKMARDAQDRIFGLANDIGKAQGKKQAPQTEQGFFTKAQ